MIKVGNKAPLFKLPYSAAFGEDEPSKQFSLKDAEGKWVVLFFYPKDMTSGCTTEAIGFRDAAAELEELGAIVLGVSKDSVARHCKFRDKHELNFPLLSDEEGKVLEKYDAWGEKKMYGKTFMGIIRSTVIIGPDRRVVAHFPKVRVKGHVDAVLEALREAQA